MLLGKYLDHLLLGGQLREELHGKLRFLTINFASTITRNRRAFGLYWFYKYPIDGSGWRSNPFKLNARFSGTTAIRAHFGFNEPLMALLSFFYDEPIKKPSIRQGLAFRYNEEVFVEQANSRDCDPNIHFGTVNQWF